MNDCKLYLKISLEALCCFLVLCWSMSLSYIECIWMETMAFYLLSIYESYRYSSKTHINVTTVAMSLIIGRVIVEIPIRLFDIHGTLWSFPITLSNIVAIIMGSICVKKKFNFLHILITLIILYVVNILNIHIIPEWISSFGK